MKRTMPASLAPQSGTPAPQSGMSTQEVFGDPAWKEERASSDNSVLITPCQPIELRLLEVRIPWEPSSFVEESDRKNIFFEAKNAEVVAFMQRVEDTLAEEGGVVNSCLAKEGLLRCKISLRQVHVFDSDRCATSAPQKFAGWTCNALVKLIGKWQTPDGGASGLNLQATDIQLLRPYQRECPF